VCPNIFQDELGKISHPYSAKYVLLLKLWKLINQQIQLCFLLTAMTGGTGNMPHS